MIAHLALVCALLATQHYDVTMTERDPGAGASRGTLDLQISPGGFVSGYYRAMSGGAPQTVTGGRRGNAIWFTIGDLSFTGTLDAKGISGQVFQDDSSTEYVLTAVPEPNP